MVIHFSDGKTVTVPKVRKVIKAKTASVTLTNTTTDGDGNTVIHSVTVKQ